MTIVYCDWGAERRGAEAEGRMQDANKCERTLEIFDSLIFW